MPKKYRLRKDIGTLKAGTIGFLYGPVHPVIGEDVPTVIFPASDKPGYFVKFSIDFVKSNPDLFEEVTERWKPEPGDGFYLVRGDGDVEGVGFAPYYQKEHGFGNCFQQKSHAIEAARRVKDTLMAYHKELAAKEE